MNFKRQQSSIIWLLCLIIGIWYVCYFIIRDNLKDNSRISQALKYAGSNRPELEKVLQLIPKSPADSLKFRAAEFLILNMHGKYSMYFDGQWNDVATVRLRWTSSNVKQQIRHLLLYRF